VLGGHTLNHLQGEVWTRAFGVCHSRELCVDRELLILSRW
jgi:hypothetical protein